MIRTLAMMSNNPAIGRVLEKGGVDRFSDLMVETIGRAFELAEDRYRSKMIPTN